MTDAPTPTPEREAIAPAVTLGVRVCYVVPQADGSELRIDFDDAVDLDPHGSLARYRLHRRAFIDREQREFDPAPGDRIEQEADGVVETYRVIAVGDDETNLDRWEVRATLKTSTAAAASGTKPGGREVVILPGDDDAAGVLVELPAEDRGAA